MKGTWNESITLINIDTDEETVLWKLNDLPEKWDHLYHFSKFAL